MSKKTKEKLSECQKLLDFANKRVATLKSTELQAKTEHKKIERQYHKLKADYAVVQSEKRSLTTKIKQLTTKNMKLEDDLKEVKVDDTSKVDNPEAHLPIEKVSKDEAERRKAIQAVRKAELQIDTLKGKLLPKHQVDADRTVQALIHIMQLRKQERLLPGILQGLDKEQIRQQISNFNQHEINKWREAMRKLNDDPSERPVISLLMFEVLISEEKREILEQLLGKDLHDRCIHDPDAVLKDQDQIGLRELGFDPSSIKHITDTVKYGDR
jgi:hypothetical protein